MSNKIEAQKNKYGEQVETFENDTFLMHLYLMHTKLYKSELMQAQVEALVTNTEIMCKRQIMCINVAWRIKSGRDEVI